MSHAVELAPAEAEPVVAPSVPTFEELTFRRFVSRRGGEPAADAAYQEARRRFEDEHGRIVLEWWSMSTASGAAVTVPQTSLLRSAVAAQTGGQLHRATDFETVEFPQAAAALHEADGLAIRCGEILRGTAQRVALTHIFAAAVSLLGFVEQVNGAEVERGPGSAPVDVDETKAAEALSERVDVAIRQFRASLSAAAAYYRDAAARATQIFYFWGMTVGVVLIAVLTSIVAYIVHLLLERADLSPDAKTFALILTAVSAGGLGACVSAMWRISSGTFAADYEAGSTHARTIGSFRPFIGAIFGLGLYVALRAGFLPTLQDQADDVYLAAFIAFLGGFSERLAPDVFAKAEDQVSAAADNRS